LSETARLRKPLCDPENAKKRRKNTHTWIVLTVT